MADKAELEILSDTLAIALAAFTAAVVADDETRASVAVDNLRDAAADFVALADDEYGWPNVFDHLLDDEDDDDGDAGPAEPSGAPA